MFAKVSNCRIDIGDAPEISTFFDRTSELSTLENWILSRTRLITILGLSGIGKTALTLQLIPQIQHEFDCIIWRSLHNAPPLESLQTDLIQSCRGGAKSARPLRARRMGDRGGIAPTRIFAFLSLLTNS